MLLRTIAFAVQALIEGLGITLSKMASPPPPSMPFPQPGMPGGPPVGAEGMAGLPPPPIGGDAAAAAGGPAAGGSEGGGWFSWLTGGEEQKVGLCCGSHVMYGVAACGLLVCQCF